MAEAVLKVEDVKANGTAAVSCSPSGNFDAASNQLIFAFISSLFNSSAVTQAPGRSPPQSPLLLALHHSAAKGIHQRCHLQGLAQVWDLSTQPLRAFMPGGGGEQWKGQRCGRRGGR
jgi:hypothetical protein